MGKYYVPDRYGNYEEYESRSDYENQGYEGCFYVLTSKVALSIIALVLAWWPFFEKPMAPLWFSIIWTVLAIINFFLPNSSDSPFMGIVRIVLSIGSVVLWGWLI
jgi:hypothetical protein